MQSSMTGVVASVALIVVVIGLVLSAGPVEAGGEPPGTDRPTPVPAEGHWQSVTNETDAEVPTVTDRGGGRYRIHVGSADPRMIVDLDVSFLQSPLDPGALTMSSVGTIAEERVVSVAVGVRFAGVDDAWAFLQNPFERFEVVSRSDLSLPFPTNTSAITNAAARSNASEPIAATPASGQDGGNTNTGETDESRGDRG